MPFGKRLHLCLQHLRRKKSLFDFFLNKAETIMNKKRFIWIAGANDITVRKAAASSYNKYQKTGQKAAERLFGVKGK